ncbi:acyl-CoA synthase [Intrasporangium oryzae NRRL B-24470]|uniref:Acyl-CoA synthase n=1 Tax=Intrasporangium oryzae NRRL B-24470 TaxID=1386089 RepID=W9GEI9_9MICO|nr:SCP2 sterol-binding domain-containing protein [Intrasporangium oryzae]EWT03632.1 acyl-CoA synthase [Intrasporangium oryzae NRRL B-24470]
MTQLDLMSATPETLAATEPAEFLAALKALSDKDITALMASGAREAVVSAIFTRMPELFRPERAGSTTATTHWDITGRPDGGSDQWTVRIADGACTVHRGHDGDSTLTLTMGPVDFAKVITKTGNPVMMFLTGKIKAQGDLGLAANVGSFFDVAKA